MNKRYWLVVLVVSASTPIAWAHAQTQPAPGDAAPRQDTMMQDGMTPGQDGSAKMEHMADAMTSMAQTCETMMQMKMQRMQMWGPFLAAACIAFGVLIAIALVLFIILEIQWVRLTGARIKSAKRSGGPPEESRWA